MDVVDPFCIRNGLILCCGALFLLTGIGNCGGLTVAGHQVPTKAALSLPSSAGQGRENRTKGSWVEVRAGRSWAKQIQLWEIS